MHPRHRRQKHLNLLWFCLSLLGIITLAYSPLFSYFTDMIHEFPYLSAFISGILFASTFTAVAGGLVIAQLLGTVSPVTLVLLVSLGAVTFDVALFLVVKDRFHLDIRDVYTELQHLGHFHRLLHTRYFAWAVPVVGALAFVSPLPDELGVEILNLSHISLFQFFFITYTAHVLGVTGLVVGLNLL